MEEFDFSQYCDPIKSNNKLLTKNYSLSYDSKKRKAKNANTVVIGGMDYDAVRGYIKPIKDLEELQDATVEILKNPHAIRFGGKLFIDYYKFNRDVLISVVLVPLFAPPDYANYMSLSILERVEVTFDYCSLVLREVYGRELISSQGKLMLNRDNMSVLCAANDNDFDNFTYGDIYVSFKSEV